MSTPFLQSEESSTSHTHTPHLLPENEIKYFPLSRLPVLPSFMNHPRGPLLTYNPTGVPHIICPQWSPASPLLILLRKHETQGPDLLGCQGVGRASRLPVCILIRYRGGFFLHSLWLELSTRTGHCCRLLAVCAEQGPWPEGEMGS